MIGDRQCGYRVFSSESSRSAVRKKLRSHDRVLPFFPGHSRVNLGSPRSLAGESVLSTDSRKTLSSGNRPLGQFPPSFDMDPRFSRPLSGSQFSHGCPGRDRACVMSECTRRWSLESSGWMQRSLLLRKIDRFANFQLRAEYFLLFLFEAGFLS